MKSIFPSKKPEKEETSELDDMKAAIKAIADGQKAMLDAFKQSNEQTKTGFTALTQALQRTATPPAPEPPKKEEQLPSDDEFENMSNKELFATIVGRVEQVLNKGLSEEVGKISGKITNNEMQQSLEKARAKYPDFDKWREAMAAEFERGGKVLTNIEDLYLLTKARNPEKAAAFAKEEEDLKKAEEGDDETPNDSDNGVIDIKSLFGGFSSGKSQDGDGKEQPPSNTREAVGSVVDRAFEDPNVRALLSSEG